MPRAPSIVTLFAALILGAVGLACQTTPTRPAAARQFYFYPPAPNPPRMQFLRAFSSRKDAGPQRYSWVDVLVGPEETPQETFLKPYGIAVERGRFYVCDTILGTVWVVNFIEGGFQPMAGDRAQGKLRKPINIRIDPADGRRYVADVGRQQIVVFGPDDRYLAAFGLPEGLQPNDVAIAGDRLYVAAAPLPTPEVGKPADAELQIRDKRTGEVLRRFASLADTPREEAVGIPTNLALDAAGNLLVSDTSGFRILTYSPEGQFITSFGQLGRRLGEFARPRGIAVDRANRIYVADAAMELVFLYNEEHQPLMWFGSPDEYRETALVLPAQVFIDHQNNEYFRKFVAPGYDLDFVVWVTNQSGPRLVSCYGFLRSTTSQAPQE